MLTDELSEGFESLARYFSVLSEPTRLRILHALCQEERCVNGIIKITALAQANVSRHLGLMYKAGMLSRRREGTQVFYRVADTMYVELCQIVSKQVAGRAGHAVGPVVSVNHFAEKVTTRPGQTPAAKRQPPANDKEQASV